MAKRDDIPKTDPSKIDALIKRLKQYRDHHRNQRHSITYGFTIS